MALGIDVFRNYFSEYKDQYILIGGAACELLLHEVGEEFRPTRDVDMVWIVEALTTEFTQRFWQFIDEGGYVPRRRQDGKCEFYRFVEPKNPSYPEMIELFARLESGVEFKYQGHLIPLHVDDEVSSLSAILLNDAYYELLLDGKVIADDVSVLDAGHLIPMKMKAWLDLTEKKANGMHVNDRDLRKHRQDVFRLFRLIGDNDSIHVPQEVLDDVKAFIGIVREQKFDTASIGIQVSKSDILDDYDKRYVLKNK